jgi:DNA helicase-2/ATP-dependent DNA helicase PcrA
MSPYSPTEEQRAIVDSDDSAIVIAGPGRGKTVTAIESAKAWLARHPAPCDVLFTSFSNAAVKRIAAASGSGLVGYERRVQFRTFHSVAMEVLKEYGRFVGIRKPARALDRTEEHLIVLERGWDASDQAAYNALRLELARSEGLIAFDLMVPMATSLLRASSVVREAVGGRFPFIVLDEFQDTKAEQWDFLWLLAASSRVLALGDPNQMIYESEHQAVLQRVAEFEQWKGIKATRFDGPNFRCKVPEIVQFADALLQGRQHKITKSVELFSVFPKQRRSKLAELWLKIRKDAGSDATIAFVVPSGRMAGELSAELRLPRPKVKFPVPVPVRVESDDGTLEAFRMMVLAAADWVAVRDDVRLRTLAVSLAVVNKKQAGGSVSQNWISAIAKKFEPKSRARCNVRDFLKDDPPTDLQAFADGLVTAMEADSEFSAAGKAIRQQGTPRMHGSIAAQGNLFEEYRKTRRPIGFDGYRPAQGRTTLVTMARSKGREFDYVILVVDPRGHSNSTSIEELRRLYYVSATRARRWLGVLHAPDRLGTVLEPVLGWRQ